ncbi:MAG: purine-binding chemotaxis protein CheW [Magnetococcales bacterium]|nr:purine-binding chemotaxis protein CheW [Magnetococcales bacterium]
MTRNRWNQFDDEAEARRWVTQQVAIPTADSQQWLLCQLGSVLCGIAVTRVVQMVRYTHSTPLPHLPPHLAGLFNLHGEVIPVLDLRLRLALPAGELSPRAILVVVQVNHPLEKESDPGKQVGILVDGVTDLLFASTGEIQPPTADMPPGTTAAGQPLIQGEVRRGEQTIYLLDVDTMLSREEMLATIARGSVTEPIHA